jgi:MscS family membrane protein
MKSYQMVAVALFLWSSASVTAWAQQAPGEPGQAADTSATVLEADGGVDALNRGTPRGSIAGFLLACEASDYVKAAEFLDLRNLPGEATEVGGPELARQLNHVLSRAVWLDDYTISDVPGGLKGDGLPDYRDELVRVRGEEGEVVLWMQRVPRGDGEMIWKVSNRSVAQIPALYDHYSYPQWIEKIRTWLPETWGFLGVPLFKWVISLGLALLSWPILHLLGLALARVFSSPQRPLYPLLKKVTTQPLVALGVVIVLGLSLRGLGMSARAQEVAEAHTLWTIVMIWLLWSVINLIRQHQQDKLERQDRPGAAKLARPIAAFFKILVLLIGVLTWLSNLGVNISTLLAGLGVGGLAVALALQKPLEDMMGALTIFTQGTIRVGDFCRYGEVFGTVEDIGLRTTRLRTLGNTVVSVPNSRIAYVEVENLTSRMMIRYWPTLRLRYDTRPEQIREIGERILDMLRTDDRIHDEPLRVRFTDFETDAVLLKVHSFVKTRDYNEYLEVAESLNYKILDIVEAVGARFALPGRSLYVEGDPVAASV